MYYYSLLFVLLGVFGTVWLTVEDKKISTKAPPATSPSSIAAGDNQFTSKIEDQKSVTGAFAKSDKISGSNGNEEKFSSSSETSFSKEQGFNLNSLQAWSRNISPSYVNEVRTDLGCENFTCTEEKGEIQPKYENADKCMEWFIDYGEGYDVNLTLHSLDLDGAAGDFLLIRADKNQPPSEVTPIFTWKLEKKRKFQVQGTGKAYVLFVTFLSKLEPKPKGFRITYTRSGELPMPSSTTPVPPPTPPSNGSESITVYIKEKDFNKERENEFTNAVAERANEFCNDTLYIPLNDKVSSENVYISLIIPCPQSWPHSNECVQMRMAIAVNTSLKEYQMNKTNLQKMWDNWNKPHGFQKFKIPNNKRSLLIWILTFTILIIAFSVLLVFLWRRQRNNEHKEVPKASVASTTYDVPALFDDDDKYDDPEFLPNNSLYYLNSETSTDDVKYSYGTVPGYDYGEPFHFSESTKGGYDNSTFLDEDGEYEIMNQNSLREAIEEDKKSRESQDHKGPGTTEKRASNETNGSKSVHYYEIPNSIEEATL